jgi:hypothetical protein
MLSNQSFTQLAKCKESLTLSDVNVNSLLYKWRRLEYIYIYNNNNKSIYIIIIRVYNNSKRIVLNPRK